MTSPGNALDELYEYGVTVSSDYFIRLLTDLKLASSLMSFILGRNGRDGLFRQVR